jgi:NAD(P)-dependent dehydrogenase (short-subunit alcohol dehydrogenase family)
MVTPIGFDGMRVWITGASSGIGAALVGPLVRRGARVAVTARRPDLLASVAAAHSRGGAAPVLVVPADVTDPAAVRAAAKQIEAAWGGIDLAIFNAGGSVEHLQSTARDPQLVADQYVQTMTLNYSSVVYGVEAVLPGMLARGNGHIAAVASLSGYRATTVALSYSASKAAVIHLMEGLRFSLEPRGVRVTVINPGFVRTPLTARNTFRMPFLVEVDDAAERIVRGLERGKHEIHFPGPLSWTLKIARMLPAPVYGWILRRAMPRPGEST